MEFAPKNGSFNEGLGGKGDTETGSFDHGWTYHINQFLRAGKPPIYTGSIGWPHHPSKTEELLTQEFMQPPVTEHGLVLPLGSESIDEVRGALWGLYAALRWFPGFPDGAKVRQILGELDRRASESG